MMTLNLLEEVKEYFNNEFISEASRNLTESEAGITEALSAILPSTIGLLSKQAKKLGGAEKIAALAKTQNSNGVLTALTSFIKHQTTASSSKLASTAFEGDIEKDMTSKIAVFSKIKESSASTLFDIALPTILALVGRNLLDNKLEVKHLADYFEAESTAKQTVLPTGFGGAGAGAVILEQPSKVVGSVPASAKKEDLAVNLHHDDLRPSHSQDPTHLDNHALHTAAIDGPVNPINSFSWVLPLLVILGLIVLLWYYTMGAGNNYVKPTMDENDTATPFLRERIQPGVESNSPVEKVSVNEQSNVGALDEKTGDFNYNEGKLQKIMLPNGQELNVGENSTEAKLVAFLKDKGIAVDAEKGNWYEFTNVHFKLNSADLDKVSDTQLRNMVAITKAFPEAKFKFGGYTDNTGDAAINKPLSQQRAEAVGKLVESFGGSANSFVAPEGYGAEHPIADNDNATGRAMNRRVAVNVKVK
ncbi:OOP family OmpA-OmpF porin [Pedobacter sp. UYP30]|uniref:OmpA family protein n=1 Tax=Pedobacter sp. UYP30 TaxID=1756400 RepID=UPI00339B0F01